MRLEGKRSERLVFSTENKAASMIVIFVVK